MSYEPPHPAELMARIKPPQAIDVEHEVLGAAMVNANVLEVLTQGLRVDDFASEAHRHIFAAMARMYARGEAIDTITLRQELAEVGRIEQVGGIPALSRLVDRCGNSENVRAYIRIVREKAALRRVLAAAQAVEAAVHSSYDGELEAALERFEVAKAERTELLRPAESWQWATEANVAAVDKDAPATLVVSTGIKALDEHLPGGGFEGGNLIVVIAAPKVGKTTYALGNVARTACEAGGRVLYCALSDAGVVRLNRKLLCGVSGVPERAVKRRDMTDRQHSQWIAAADKIAGWKLHIERIKSAKGIVERAKTLARNGDLVLVVVDYLQRTSNGKREMWQDIGESTGVLQDGANDLGIPFLVLSQPTTTARREGKAIKASDTKGGGTAEEDGDLVMLLHKGQRDPKAAGLSILAARDAEPRVWHAEDGVVSGNSVYACGWRWDYSSMRLEER